MLENASTIFPLSWKSLEYEAFMAATASLQSLMAFSSRIFCDVLTPMTPKTDDNGYDDGTANQVLDMVMYPSVAILHALRYGDLEWIFGSRSVGSPRCFCSKLFVTIGGIDGIVGFAGPDGRGTAESPGLADVTCLTVSFIWLPFVPCHTSLQESAIPF